MYRPNTTVPPLDIGQFLGRPAPAQTEEDYLARQELLMKLGLQDSFLGKANDFGGALLERRDNFREDLRDGAKQALLGGAAKASM